MNAKRVHIRLVFTHYIRDAHDHYKHNVLLSSREHDQIFVPAKQVFTDCRVLMVYLRLHFLLRLPVGRGGVLNSPRFCFFPVSKVGLPLMGDTAGSSLLFSALLHIILTHFIAGYINKTHILTCIRKYLNENKVLRAKIPTKDVLKRQILTDSIAKHYCLCRGKHIV